MFYVYYLLMGCTLGCYFMVQPGITALSETELKSLLATCFLMWPLLILGLLIESFKKDE